MNYSSPRFGSMPPVIKTIIGLNVLMFLATWVARTAGINLNQLLGLYTPTTERFHIYQYVSYMFMHGGLEHLFFNMFALWMFGRVLEQVWGSRRMLTYYMVTGLGAALIHTGVNLISLSVIRSDAAAVMAAPSPDAFAAFVNNHFAAYYDQVYSKLLEHWFNNPYSSELISQASIYIQQLIDLQANIPTVGASGAVYGVLLAFGMLFPNTQIMLLIPPIPLKAKWMVIGYGALELFLGLTQPGSSVAHFAHLGGMIFGFFLIRHWRQQRDIFY